MKDNWFLKCWLMGGVWSVATIAVIGLTMHDDHEARIEALEGVVERSASASTSQGLADLESIGQPEARLDADSNVVQEATSTAPSSSSMHDYIHANIDPAEYECVHHGEKAAVTTFNTGLRIQWFLLDGRWVWAADSQED